MSQEHFLKVSPESKFIKDLEKHTKFQTALYEKFEVIKGEFGIWSIALMPFRQLTLPKNMNDQQKFTDDLLADRRTTLTFKKKSKINKRWLELTRNIEFVREPLFQMYFKQMLNYWNAISFWLDDHMYIRLETIQQLEQVDWMQVITPVEFYAAKEQSEKAGE